jgi:hypothetical protein
MKLAIFGATGGTGRLLVEEALAAGHEVVAFVRNPSKLTARLDATSPGIAPFLSGSRPELHFLRALGWFREAGLEEPRARTFLGQAFAPLSQELRLAVVDLVAMRWPGVEPELSEQDRDLYRHLCLPDSPQFIVDDPDYYAFFTCSLFSGTVPQPPAQKLRGT